MSSKTARRDPVLAHIDPAELEGPVEESWLKPYVIALIGVVLLLLTVSLIFSDFLQNRIESRPVQEGVLGFNDVSVVFRNGTLVALQEEFVRNQHREIKACLFGQMDGAAYIIGRVVFPEVLRANVAHIVSVPCPEDVLIDVHSHPIDQCLASEQDISVLRGLQVIDGRVRMLVMCGQDRFALI